MTAQMKKFDILISGGTVFDGSGRPPLETDVGISGGLISFIGRAQKDDASSVVEAKGFYVTPGFIDTHSHSDFTLLADPLAAEGKLFQGVTCEVNGNCGLSGGPLIGAARQQRESDLVEYGIKERWESLGQYLDILEARGLLMNFATLTGHGNLRASVIGYADRAASDVELNEMAAHLEGSLQAGAIGLSTGLIYPPGAYSRTEELLGLAQAGRRAAAGNFIYATHMRSEGDNLIEAIQEAVTIGRVAGRLQVSHMKTAGRQNWNKISQAIETVETARASGLRATADRYPYTAASTDLDTILPAWAYEGGSVAELARLKDPATLRKISAGIQKDALYWESVYISSTPNEADRWMEGKSLGEIALAGKKSPLETLFHILVRGEVRVQAIFHSMNEDNLRRLYGLPWVMVGSDSSARSFSGPSAKGKPHPRTFGTFPRFLKRYTIEEGVVGMEEAVRKITALPADTFGLAGRGMRKEGFFADVAVFDPGRLADTATFEEPFQKARGVGHLIVNGEAVISEGALTGKRPGRVLRKGK